jgi:N-acetylneuraminic acid mutarotase
MRKVYLLPFIFVLACKEKNTSITPTPTDPVVIVEPPKEKVFKTDNFVGFFKGRSENVDDQFIKKTASIFTSISKSEKNDLQIKLQSNCPNSSEIVLKATAQSDSTVTFSQQTVSQFNISGDGKLTKDGIQIKLSANDKVLFDYKALRIEKINVETLRIEEISQPFGLERDSLVIKGKGFSELLIQNLVNFDDQKAEIIEAKSDFLKVIIPNRKDKFAKISVSVNDCQNAVFEQQFEYLTDQWELLNADLPRAGRWYATTFMIGDKAYLCTGIDENRERLKDLWEFDPKTLRWTEKAEFPGSARNASVAFVIDGMAYVGTGYDPKIGSTRDFYKYNPQKDEWSQISDFPGKVREHAVGFALNGKGYVTTGKSLNGWVKDNWEYDPKTDKWTRKADVPGPDRGYVANAFVYDNKVLLGGGNSIENDGWRSDWYEYNPINDTWTQKASFLAKDPTSFQIGERFYVMYENTQKMAVYDPKYDKWIKLRKPIDKFTLQGATFSFQNRGFFGTGFNGIYKRTFWEYKP